MALVIVRFTIDRAVRGKWYNFVDGGLEAVQELSETHRIVAEIAEDIQA